MSVDVADLYQAVAHVPVDDALELACKAHLGVWSEVKRGFDNAPHHWEWSELRMVRSRLAVCAPREHAKTEVFTVNGTAWESIYRPGLWTYIFAQTGDQAMGMKERIDQAVAEAAPWMVDGPLFESNRSSSQYANLSRVDCAGAGKGVRSVHPDVIVGDDVLEESNCLTSHQRKAVARWWFGTISGMSHPGTTRALGHGTLKVTMPPTRVYLVGTPFHQQDLLMSMRANPVYEFRRYAAEFDLHDLVAGTMAVEVV